MIPRLYVDTHLFGGAQISLDADDAHYVRTVLRRKAGDRLCLFNVDDGEWQARLTVADRKAVRVLCEAQLRAPRPERALHLLFAPVKRTPLDLTVRMGTELGVTLFQPILTARTVVERVKTERLKAIAKEAAEQTGRLALPVIAEPVALSEIAFAQTGEGGPPYLFCDEAGDDPQAQWGGERGRAEPIGVVVKNLDTAPRGLVTGPEGGFTPDERSWLRTRPQILPVSLGPRILRADTAAVAALSVLQALKGDWT